MSQSRSSRARPVPIAWLSAAALVVIAVAGLATLAVAKTTRKSKPLVKAVHNSSQKATILVDANGMTLYELKPETSRHLLCSSTQCLQFWPPAKVGKHVKLVKGSGVKGTLGRLHRRGFDQLTLDGRPLYRFSGDSGKGSTAGQGIQSFGGTWHVVKESGSRTTQTTTTTTTTSSTSSSPYPYPSY